MVGGGAAGYFSAITAAEAAPDAEVTLLEKGAQFLAKVRISGGGRCNVTHACFEPRELTVRYPRGERELIAPFHRFQAKETVEWFQQRGVKLKVEPDGRMFPVSNSSQTIIDCLMEAATSAGVKLVLNRGVNRIVKNDRGPFTLTLSNGEVMECDRVMLATGGCRAAVAGELATSLGHTLVPPVPSLFTFHIDARWLHELAGVSLDAVEASVPELALRERGPILITHWGLSGPVILRLSAWGARKLHDVDYAFKLLVNWLPHLTVEQVGNELQKRREGQGARLIVNSTIAPLTARLWEQLIQASGISRETRWAALGKAAQHKLVQTLTRSEFQVTGKSLNKEEFVTCGGVQLNEVNFKTMESRKCPGLFFAGELLDIDGITGGFNFQAAWTTGWIAGQSMVQ